MLRFINPRGLSLSTRAVYEARAVQIRSRLQNQVIIIIIIIILYLCLIAIEREREKGWDGKIEERGREGGGENNRESRIRKRKEGEMKKGALYINDQANIYMKLSYCNSPYIYIYF